MTTNKLVRRERVCVGAGRAGEPLGLSVGGREFLLPRRLRVIFLPSRAVRLLVRSHTTMEGREQKPQKQNSLRKQCESGAGSKNVSEWKRDGSAEEGKTY